MKVILSLILIGALAFSCATVASGSVNISTHAAAKPATNIDGVTVTPVPSSVADYASTLGILGIVHGAKVPDKPGVSAITNNDGNAIVTWMTRLPAADIRLVGDYEGWKPDLGLVLNKAVATNGQPVHVISFLVKPDATIIYKYMVNGNWTEDACAPATVDDGFGGHSGKVVVKALMK